MNLHEHKEEFEELIAIVADYIGVPADAVRRDYYIVQMMQNLQNSEYAEVCVFKGGTSLSKCYPGSINRFSEDIDLTFIPVEDMTNKAEVELRPFMLTGDSFPKIVVRKDIGKRWYDDNGILNINVIDFLLDKELI